MKYSQFSRQHLAEMLFCLQLNRSPFNHDVSKSHSVWKMKHPSPFLLPPNEGQWSGGAMRSPRELVSALTWKALCVASQSCSPRSIQCCHPFCSFCCAFIIFPFLSFPNLPLSSDGSFFHPGVSQGSAKNPSQHKYKSLKHSRKTRSISEDCKSAERIFPKLSAGFPHAPDALLLPCVCSGTVGCLWEGGFIPFKN